ncbi:MAG: hypothetical protein ACSHYF_07620 [Verrucomicrobiaceae bacterium]
MAVPLAKVLSPDPVEQAPVPTEQQSSALIRTDVLIRSAHPFTKVTLNDVTIGGDQSEAELQLDPTIPLTIDVEWPPGTPESALFIELIPDGLEMKNHTIWGTENAFEEVTFNWKEQP